MKGERELPTQASPGLLLGMRFKLVCLKSKTCFVGTYRGVQRLLWDVLGWTVCVRMVQCVCVHKNVCICVRVLD